MNIKMERKRKKKTCERPKTRKFEFEINRHSGIMIRIFGRIMGTFKMAKLIFHSMFFPHSHNKDDTNRPHWMEKTKIKMNEPSERENERTKERKKERTKEKEKRVDYFMRLLKITIKAQRTSFFLFMLAMAHTLFHPDG